MHVACNLHLWSLCVLQSLTISCMHFTRFVSFPLKTVSCMHFMRVAISTYIAVIACEHIMHLHVSRDVLYAMLRF